ncbi:hypothetical protein L1887_23511 [Cichorium endivia]|nr:hypothetical protein L1887_23511 [Cichorium endivia]
MLDNLSPRNKSTLMDTCEGKRIGKIPFDLQNPLRSSLSSPASTLPPITPLTPAKAPTTPTYISDLIRLPLNCLAPTSIELNDDKPPHQHNELTARHRLYPATHSVPDFYRLPPPEDFQSRNPDNNPSHLFRSLPSSTQPTTTIDHRR